VKMRYDLHDALGSVVAQVSLDEDEPQVVWAAQYDACGKKLAESSETPNPYRWGGAHGYYADEDVGMYLMGYRWYDSFTGRFISRDPIGFAAGDMNQYRPMGNNPANAVDPWGLLTPVGPLARELVKILAELTEHAMDVKEKVDDTQAWVEDFQRGYEIFNEELYASLFIPWGEERRVRVLVNKKIDPWFDQGRVWAPGDQRSVLVMGIRPANADPKIYPPLTQTGQIPTYESVRGGLQWWKGFFNDVDATQREAKAFAAKKRAIYQINNQIQPRLPFTNGNFVPVAPPVQTPPR